ncbi:MAG: DUF1800 family protein [Luteolibacter sp.]|uniref:DUF1800 family protein n=1 Tax=Luteolibacter sp. TaxID=1962973 RepID=UPI0032639A9B
MIGLSVSASAQFDAEINRQVWKQKYGVLDAQMSEQAPYTGWLSQDADGDGVKNSAEFLAGTNPFKKLPADPNFRPPSVNGNPSSLSLTFPTVPGKLYGVESNDSLLGAWTRGSLSSVTGDGTNKTLVVPKSAGKFFHLSVTDQATQGDMVSDWAKIVLGLSAGSPIGSQSSFNNTTLASNLQTQNVITVIPVDLAGTQPGDAATPAGDFAVIRITRSGHMLLGDITLPLTKSGSAVEGVDFAPLPSSVTFPAGVKSLDLKITPLFNASRTSSATVFLTANAPESAGASGNYALGSPAFAGVTLYPSGSASGNGLTGTFYPGSSATYASTLNFGDQVATTYAYTKSGTNFGTAVVTYFGNPATPLIAGNQVSLQFTSSTLNISPFNTLRNYTIIAPVTANTFTVNITGTTAASSTGTPTSVIAGFSPPVVRLTPLIDSTWLYGSPNGNNYVNVDNYSAVWDGMLSPPSTGNYLFRLDADDKAQVSIDLNDGNGYQEILQNGWTSPATGGYKISAPIALQIPATQADRYPIRVKFVETTGSAKCKFQWQPSGQAFANIPSANIWVDKVATIPGTTTNTWTATYYNNPTFTIPEARIQLEQAGTNEGNGAGDWGTGSPDPMVFHNNFSSRWAGQVLPQYTETYFFVVKANQGAKLWVNNQLIIDKWADATSDQTGSISLQAGVLYDIKLEHYETTGSCEAHLSWYSDDQAKQIIPTSRLFPTTSGSTPLGGNPPAGKPTITSPPNPVYVLGSGSPISLPITTSNGGTITASGLPPWLTLVNGVLTGTPPAAGTYQFTVTTTNAAGSGSSVITLEVQAAEGVLTRDLWTSGVTGPGLANVPWASPPSSSDTVALAEDAVTTYGANTGERLRGYFIAPVSGNYYFWIAASNTAELWISNDSEPVNKVRRAFVTDSPARTWNAQPSQKSQWLTLVAGRKYYIEALHNTGTSAAGNHLSVAWFLDPSGNTANPIANGCPPATPAVGGIIPNHAISSWDNPPTTTIPGTLYVTNLQGAPDLGNITGTGGSFLRVNGSTAVLQLTYSGLTSGAVSKKLYISADQVIFDLGAQDKNYPALKTTDGGFTWNMQPADLTALNNGQVRIVIATVDHPDGELSGTFGKTAGSQTAPAVPASPTWTDDHSTSDAANSRFLSQTTFGPSQTDMNTVKTSGYRAWIDTQMDGTATPPTRNIPYLLANPGTDPGNQFSSVVLFNSWWKNSVTAPDQLRQRAAFALSEILVVSDVGPLNNNGRVLGDYYDTMLDSCFGNFRDILKQVTLSPAMGVYLDMRGNSAGSIVTGVHPNENYAREILQLFSAGLYRVWPNGTLVLDSKGNAVPTYDQSVITGMARVFTGWTWAQPVGSRLPTGFSPADNYLDPMVLVPVKHELGTKILLDSVILPAATFTTQSDGTNETNPLAPVYTVQARATATDPLTDMVITNMYDRNGLRDLEVTLDNILNNSATGPYICRQLIQRLVTSHPKPDYIHRVVRAFNGEQNIDGVRTGVRGDMKDVFRAILLDYEARSTAAAADPQFGKQREPVLRITGPARAFPAIGISGATYRGLGYQQMLVTTTNPHRLGENETAYLDTFTDLTPGGSKLPTEGTYTVKNTVPTYNVIGSVAVPSSLVTINAPGYQAGDVVKLQFTSGTVSTTGTFNTVQTYTVQSATPSNFVINLGTNFTANISGNTLMPYNFTVDGTSLTSVNYNVVGTTVTVTASGYVAGQKLYLKFATGGLQGIGIDGTYTIDSSTGTTFNVTLAAVPASLVSGKVLIPKIAGGYKVVTTGGVSTITFYTAGNHNLNVNDTVQVDFLTTNTPTGATDGIYTVTAFISPTIFSIAAPTVISDGTQGGSGMVGYPLVAPPWARNGTLNITMNTWNISYTQNDLNQTPINSTTVFNFFYPDYKYPGAMAAAGMTTPEFQLSNDSNTMNLTNAITSTAIGSGNTNGYSSYKSNAITLDLSPYMTSPLTNDAGIPGLVDTLGTFLTGSTLTPAARTTVIDYAKSLPYTTPKNTEMRDRVRAIVHLIVTSAEFAIQK